MKQVIFTRDNSNISSGTSNISVKKLGTKEKTSNNICTAEAF